jgi:hypothetical protein
MLPNLSGAVMAWVQPFSVDRITKTITNYQAVETKTTMTFKGIVAPLKQTDLELKPEGQRQWRWLEIHSTTDLNFALDDQLIWRTVTYRIMAAQNWADYGYYRYELAEAFV